MAHAQRRGAPGSSGPPRSSSWRSPPSCCAGLAGTPPEPPVTAEGNEAPTVTVVPFESLNETPDQAYLARGLSNDLMTDLSRLGGLRVLRTSSAAESAGNARFVITAAVQRDTDTLRVNVRSTGTVQRVADTLRVNVQLTDSRNGQQLWSERFERPFGDLFADAGRDHARRRRTPAGQAARSCPAERGPALHQESRRIRPLPARAGAVPRASRGRQRGRACVLSQGDRTRPGVRARLRRPGDDLRARAAPAPVGRRRAGARARARARGDGTPDRSPTSRKCIGDRPRPCAAATPRQGDGLAEQSHRAQSLVCRRLRAHGRHPYY